MKDEITSGLIGPGEVSLFRSSDQISKDLETLIRENDAVEPKDIDYEVHKGVVTLRGTVRDEFAKEQAEHAAREVLGVVEVHNELEIGE